MPRYADVLTFENCANIYVTHITAGHTQEPSQCAGGVLHFISSQDILVEDCDLYGCGTLGVDADNSLNIQVINNLIHDCSPVGIAATDCRNVTMEQNDIYECSYGGIQLMGVATASMDGNTFRDLGMEDYPGSVFRIYDSQNVTCNGKDAIPFQ